MISIGGFIRQNMVEAHSIIAERGGRIDFASNISIIKDAEDGGDYTDWRRDDSDNLPYVIVDYGDGVLDVPVLSARCNGDDVEFLVMDEQEHFLIGWISQAECVNYSENEIYMTIAELYKRED